MTGAAPARSSVAAHARGTVLALTVTPRSARNTVEVQDDGELRVRITAAPVDGAANGALLRFLADVLDVPRTRLELVSGVGSRHKRVLVTGIDPRELERRLRGASGIG